MSRLCKCCSAANEPAGCSATGSAALVLVVVRPRQNASLCLSRWLPMSTIDVVQRRAAATTSLSLVTLTSSCHSDVNARDGQISGQPLPNKVCKLPITTNTSNRAARCADTVSPVSRFWRQGASFCTAKLVRAVGQKFNSETLLLSGAVSGWRQADKLIGDQNFRLSPGGSFARDDLVAAPRPHRSTGGREWLGPESQVPTYELEGGRATTFNLT